MLSENVLESITSKVVDSNLFRSTFEYALFIGFDVGQQIDIPYFIQKVKDLFDFSCPEVEKYFAPNRAVLRVELVKPVSFHLAEVSLLQEVCQSIFVQRQLITELLLYNSERVDEQISLQL